MSDTNTIDRGLINITCIEQVRDHGFDHGIVSGNVSYARAGHNTTYLDILMVLFIYDSYYNATSNMNKDYVN